MKKYFPFLIFLLLADFLSAQHVAIGNWQEHLSYTNGLSVSEGNGKVYCATNSGLFTFNTSDNSLERLSKVNGLSDVEPSVLNFNKHNNKLLIAYKNSNIDIIDNGLITNVGDIVRKAIVGNKTINNIYFINQYAYLACGFGIVVVDMDKYEIKDTYYIGISGNSLNIRDITSDNTYLYAASDSGIYRAPLNSPNLANYTAWTVMTGLPKGIYNSIATMNGKIITNFSKFLKNGNKEQDTLFVYNGASWNKYAGSGYVVNSIKNCDNKLVVA